MILPTLVDDDAGALRGFVIAEATFGQLAGTIGRHAAGDQLLRAHVEMKREFIVDIGLRLEAEHVPEARAPGHRASLTIARRARRVPRTRRRRSVANSGFRPATGRGRSSSTRRT